MKNLVALIESKNYNSVIEILKKSVRIEVNDDYPEVVLNHDKNKLDVAKVNIRDLESLLNLDSKKIIEYVKMKLVKYLNVEMEQEYADGEEPDEDEKDVVLKVSPFYKNFLTIYLIEYYFLKNSPDDLEGYISAIRIPGAKKYAKELKEIYNKI